MVHQRGDDEVHPLDIPSFLVVKSEAFQNLDNFLKPGIGNFEVVFVSDSSRNIVFDTHHLAFEPKRDRVHADQVFENLRILLVIKRSRVLVERTFDPAAGAVSAGFAVLTGFAAVSLSFVIGLGWLFRLNKRNKPSGFCFI